MFLIPVPHSHHSGNLVTARVSGGGQALSWHGSRRGTRGRRRQGTRPAWLTTAEARQELAAAAAARCSLTSSHASGGIEPMDGNKKTLQRRSTRFFRPRENRRLGLPKEKPFLPPFLLIPIPHHQNAYVASSINARNYPNQQCWDCPYKLNNSSSSNFQIQICTSFTNYDDQSFELQGASNSGGHVLGVFSRCP